MRKQFSQVAGLFLVITLFAGCQKELNKPSISSQVNSNANGGVNGNKIRLTSVSSDYGTNIYKYNSEGLIYSWELVEVGYLFIHEFDENKLLSKAWFYMNGLLVNTVAFFYNDKGQRFHEIWYEGSTSNIADEIFYTFDNNGNGIKTESMLGYSVIHTYSPQGNLLSWSYYINDVLILGSTYTYDNRLKNPTSAIPGLIFAWPFVNGFFDSNKWYSTSESYSEYDEDGTVIYSTVQDPAKTEAVAGPQNYVATSNFWDVSFATFINFKFTYENCGQCETKKIHSSSVGNNMKTIKQRLLKIRLK